MSQSLLEKLQLKDEKNLLIQGIPSTLEKQFSKLAFAKNLTPLLKSKKIDFALVFAINEPQLKGIVCEVMSALQPNAPFWVAYPKPGSKIATTLNRECTWLCITDAGYVITDRLPLDHVWTAIQFKRVAAPVLTERAAVGQAILEEAGMDKVGVIAPKVPGVPARKKRAATAI